ncbi:MAG: hypothetical protein M3Q55_15430 [Acidobacteriota bacterium]|nr:hypothetical protein [Acidobacteriota bacterium]
MTRSRALIAGWLVVGFLDLLDAFLFFGLRSGVHPTRILHAIAAGVFGRDGAIGGGAMTASIGLTLHFFIAFAVVIVAYLAGTRAPALVARPFISGPIYGLIVYAVMNYVVIPLSAAPGAGGVPEVPILVNGLLVHIFGVGIPAMWFARAAARPIPVRSL